MKLTVAFRILAFGIFVTHFRIVTGTEKHCCRQMCLTVVRSNYKTASCDSEPELDMETDSTVHYDLLELKSHLLGHSAAYYDVSLRFR